MDRIQDYHTFVSLDHFKIFVRCSDSTTDVIILNMDRENVQMLANSDLEKIALWFQARVYPYDQQDSQTVKLAQPFTKENTQYFPENYSGYWVKKVGKETFDFSYERILGKNDSHKTNLYLGLNITNDLLEEEKKSFNRIEHLFTPMQDDYNILEQRSLTTTTLEDEKSGVGSKRCTSLAPSSLPSSPKGKEHRFFSRRPEKDSIEEEIPLNPRTDI